MMPTLNHILYSSAALVALTAPFAELPIFLAIVKGQSVRQSRMSALKVALAVFIILNCAVLGGSEILRLFGVSLAAFRAAGGFLLICVGLQMMHGEISQPQHSTNAEFTRDDQLLVPFVMPLTAGPAPITAAITLSIRDEGRLLGLPLGTLVAVGIATLVVLVMLWLAVPLNRLLGPRIGRITERFFGVILIAIGFQMGMNGVQQFYFAA
jgi:multiple antibiotic resistance protein